MLRMVVREELKIPVTRACLKHLSLQLSSLQYYRNTPSTKPMHKSNVKPAPDSNYYQVNPHKTKLLSQFGDYSLFIFCCCVALKPFPVECWSTSAL